MIDALIKGIRPTRTFVKLSRPLINIGEARAVFRVLADYGEMVEYKIMRCPETLKYLQYGFVTYKKGEDAEKVILDKFFKIQADEVDQPLEVKIEKSVNVQGQQRRDRYKDQ